MGQEIQNIKIQKQILVLAVFLFLLKTAAWQITHSVSIFTDALESIINIATGAIGLYSLVISSRPKDKNHPYGHGKIEFVSAAIEGTLIMVAAVVILFESVKRYRYPREIHELDLGIILLVLCSVLNGLMGYYAIKVGKRNRSIALESGGRHLLTDTFSTLAIIAGLILIYFTDIALIDLLVASMFAFYILFIGYRILRRSLAGIMDEADEKLLKKLVSILNENRRKNWIDLHNLRIIKYGSVLHLDCHLTVPWYFNVNEAHHEIEILDNLIKEHFGNKLEMFVHTDGCMDYSCVLCEVVDCEVRKSKFERSLKWTIKNISSNSKHMLTKAV